VVDVYINYLRRKVDSGYDRPLIRSIRGTGYLNRDERLGPLTKTRLGTSKRPQQGLWLERRKSAPDIAIGAPPTVSRVAL
jgi:hypothetical protein